MVTLVKRPEEIRRILAEACERGDLLILATPYLRFESSFLALGGEELQVSATMGRDDAAYGLRAPDLLMRFPVGLGFMEAEVEARGLGAVEGRRSLRLSIPREIRENDQRVAYRVERVGRVVVPCRPPQGETLQTSLLDISITGARLLLQRERDAARLPKGTPLALCIPLAPGLRIETGARVCHLGARTLGACFEPPLPPALEGPLSRWIFLRREEELERMALRLERAAVRRSPAGIRPPAGLLLVTADPELEAGLGEALGPVLPLQRIPPSIQPLKEALAGEPPLVIFHVREGAPEERRRLGALVEEARNQGPVLLVGTGLDGATLFELSGAWKASSAMVWTPSRAAFLERLARGIIRRHGHGGESPMAPREGHGPEGG